jgi:hypothetical protein
VADLLRQGLRVGWLTFRAADPGTRALAAANDRLIVVPADPDPDGFARALFATLHALDRRALDRLVVDLPPSDEPWLAVRDRIRRAARETDD